MQIFIVDVNSDFVDLLPEAVRSKAVFMSQDTTDENENASPESKTLVSLVLPPSETFF